MVGQKYTWQGFEFIPTGCLLEQTIDLSESMGFAYERSTKYYKDFHTHDRLMLIFPRGSTAMEVRTQNPRQQFVVDYNSVLFVPKELEHDDESVSAIYDTMAFYPSDQLLEQAYEKLKMSTEQIKKIRSDCFLVKRTEMMNQIAQAYFFERVVLNKNNHDKEATQFLGRRLLEEVFLTLFFEEKLRDFGSDFEADGSQSVAARALRFIEANLFEPLELDFIAQKANASVSTLLRHFRDEVGATPFLYIKNRRLEEAMRLLKTGQHPVSDVASLVGYENFGAFSEAFKEKYKEPPSFFKGKESESIK